MAFIDDVKNKVNTFFKEPYKLTETKTVPSTQGVKLTFGNSGLLAELCFIFIDIRASSKLHAIYGVQKAAKIYQSFHAINVKIITRLGGEVRSFDGDRIMAVFSGDEKCSNATKAAMQIRWAIENILNPNLKTQINPNRGIQIGVGIDYGETLITKVGKGRNTNNHDLIWIGQACNNASHLCQEANNSIIISEKVYKKLSDSIKFSITSKRKQNRFKEKKITLKTGTFVKCFDTNNAFTI